MPLKKLLSRLAAISGRSNLLIPVPGRVAERITAVLEFIADHVTRRPPCGTAEGVRIALRSTGLPFEKAKRELGYAPRPIDSALAETIADLLTIGGTASEPSLPLPISNFSDSCP